MSNMIGGTGMRAKVAAMMALAGMGDSYPRYRVGTKTWKLGRKAGKGQLRAARPKPSGAAQAKRASKKRKNKSAK